MNKNHHSQTIALFPGCFDPIHLQHQKIVEIIAANDQIDEVWILVNKDSEEKSIVASFSERISLIKAVFEKHPKIKIWPNPIGFYTEIVVKDLQAKFPNHQFQIILGSDQINQLSHWAKIRDLGKTIPILGIPRKNFPINTETLAKFDIKMIDNLTINNINSSEIKIGKNWHYLNSKVKKILQTKPIYWFNILKHAINNRPRFDHSIAVAKLGMEIAEKIGAKDLIQTIYFAGLFHDLAKKWKEEAIKTFYTKHQLEVEPLLKLPQPVWHGWVAAYFLQYEMKITNQSIIAAIKYHTTGHVDFDQLAKILFVADKLEPRKRLQPWFRKAQQLLQQPTFDFEELFLLTLEGTRQKSLIKKQKSTEITLATWKKFLAK